MRSGFHPGVGVTINPALLKSSVANDPELSTLLGVSDLRKRNEEQGEALVQAREEFETLEQKYRTLESDFHAAVSSRREVDPNAPRIPLSADCILAVRAARARACPCDKSLCPVFYSGEDCDQKADYIPQCLAPWNPPFTRQLPWTLNQESIKKMGKLEDVTISLGNYPMPNRQSLQMTLEMTPSLLDLLPQRASLRNDTYRSCAMVGNSDILLREYMGDEITDHDLVVRFNGATTKNFEKHVGRVTNLRFVTSDWLGFREFPQETVVHLDPHSGEPLFGCDRQVECTNATTTMWKWVEDLKLMRQLRVQQLHPEVVQWLARTYRDDKGAARRLSSGSQVLLLLSHVCQKVDVYGFAGSGLGRYFDSAKVQQQFSAAVAKWAIEHKHGEPVSYPYRSNPFRKLLGEEGGEEVPIGVQRGAGAAAARFRRGRSALEMAALDDELELGLLRREEEGGGGGGAARRLLKKKGGGGPKPLRPQDMPGNQLVDEPNFMWERQCQQDMVDKGMIAVHGVHQEFEEEGMAMVASKIPTPPK